MADHSHIEWTDATWNPITGCSVVSPGCINCYAMRLAGTRLRAHPSRAGLTRPTKAGPVWNGDVRLNEQWLDQPLRWKRPRMIFVCAHGDLFHESVPDAWIDRVFAVMVLANNLTYQLLTKRSARMRRYLSDGGRLARIVSAAMEMSGYSAGEIAPKWPLPNVWLGVSAERQQEADERLPDLKATPAAVRWVSYEPALGPIGWTGFEWLQWIVSGGESGPGARPSHPDWHRATRDFCTANGIAYHFKQWGAWLDERSATAQGYAPDASMFDRDGRPHGDRWRFYDANDRNGGALIRVGKKAAGRLLDGREHNDMPIPRPRAGEGSRAAAGEGAEV